MSSPPAPDGRVLRELLRPVRGRIVGCMLLSVGGAAAGLTAFVAIAELARTAVDSSGALAASADEIRAWAVVAALAVLARLVLLEFSSNLGHHADAILLRHLRRRVVARVGAAPLGELRGSGSGWMKRTMTDEIEELHQLVGHTAGQLAGGLTVVLGGAVYLITVDPVLTAITFAVPVLSAVSFFAAMRSMPAHVTRLMAADARVAATAVEYADAIAVVKTYGGGGRLLSRFGAAVIEYTRAFGRWVRQTRWSSGLSLLLGSEITTLLVTLAAGTALVRGGRVEFTDVVPFALVAIALPVTLRPTVLAGTALKQGLMAAHSLYATLSAPVLPTTTVPREPADGTVEFDHVDFAYDADARVLHDIRIRCAPGTLTALVGPSGAGKSTLAGLLPRFYDVTGGAVRIGGVDVRDMTAATLLGNLALVFQDVVLLHDTVAANLRLTRPDATDEQLRDAARAAQVHDVIEQLPRGYDTVLGGSGPEASQLSGGERQRLTIARALLADASVVILDEPTASLDPDSEAAVQQALSALSVGRTVIAIAHRLRTIAGADQIVVLDAGRVVEQGTHADLLGADGRYAAMWAAQQAVPA